MKNKQGGGERDLLERVMHNRFFRGTALFVRRYFDHRVARDSAALTYYLLFAMFPLLIFLSNLVGFFAVDIEGFLCQLGTIIPAEVLDLLIQYLRYVSRVSSRTLMTFSLIFSIWFPMRAANALLLSVRKAYGMGRPTQFLRHQAKVFLYTICLILTILLSLVLVTVGRSVLGTMTTTLMLAYSGNYLSMLMYFVGQGTPLSDIVNLKYVSSQLLNTLVGSFGLVVAAPLTALIAGFCYTGERMGRAARL